MQCYNRGHDYREAKATFKSVVKHQLMSDALFILYLCSHYNLPILYPISDIFSSFGVHLTNTVFLYWFIFCPLPS